MTTVFISFQNCTSSDVGFKDPSSLPSSPGVITTHGSGEPYDGKTTKYLGYDTDASCSDGDLTNPQVEFIVEREDNEFYVSKGPCYTDTQDVQFGGITLTGNGRVRITDSVLIFAFNDKILSSNNHIFQSDVGTRNGDLVVEAFSADVNAAQKIQIEILRKTDGQMYMQYFVGNVSSSFNDLEFSSSQVQTTIDKTAADAVIYAGQFTDSSGAGVGSLTVNHSIANNNASVVSVGNIENSLTVNVNDVAGVVADSCAVADPAVGANCSGGTIFAGVFQGRRLMLTPSGCDDQYVNNNPITDNPICDGSMDSLRTYWQGLNGTALTNFSPGVDLVNDPAELSTIDGETSTAAMISSPFIDPQGSAAHYCDNLVYGGYDDWYLPNKSEMAHLYCHSESSNHNPLYPNENPDCASYGGKQNILKGWNPNGYWTSTDYGGIIDNVMSQDFTTGEQNFDPPKNDFVHTRCIRSD